MRTRITLYLYFAVFICEYESGTSSSSLSLEDHGSPKDRIGLLIPEVPEVIKKEKSNQFKMHLNIRTKNNTRYSKIFRPELNPHVKKIRQPRKRLENEHYNFQNTPKRINYGPKYKIYPRVRNDKNVNKKKSSTTDEFYINGKENKHHKHKLLSVTETAYNVTRLSHFEADMSKLNKKISDVLNTSNFHFYPKRDKSRNTKRNKEINILLNKKINKKISHVLNTSNYHFHPKRDKSMNTKRNKEINILVNNKPVIYNSQSQTTRTTELTTNSYIIEKQIPKKKKKHFKLLVDVSDELDKSNVKYISKMLQPKETMHQETMNVSLNDKPKRHKDKISRTVKPTNYSVPQNKTKHKHHHSHNYHVQPGSKADIQRIESTVTPTEKTSIPKISKHSLATSIPISSGDIVKPNTINLIENSTINIKRKDGFNPRKNLFTLTISDVDEDKSNLKYIHERFDTSEDSHLVNKYKQIPQEISTDFLLSKMLRENKDYNLKTMPKDSSAPKPEVIEVGIIDDMLKSFDHDKFKENNTSSNVVTEFKGINDTTTVQPNKELSVNLEKNQFDNFTRTITFKKSFDTPKLKRIPDIKKKENIRKKEEVSTKKDQFEIPYDDFSKAEILLTDEGDENHNHPIGRYRSDSSSDSDDSDSSSDSSDRSSSKHRWFSCLGKRANSKCRKACRDAYTDVCKRLRCSSRAKKDLRYECKKRCKRTFQSSKYSTEK